MGNKESARASLIDARPPGDARRPPCGEPIPLKPGIPAPALAGAAVRDFRNRRRRPAALQPRGSSMNNITFSQPHVLVLAAAAFGFMTISSIASAAPNPKIGEYAIYPITQKGYPNIYAAWGDAGVKRINELMLPAAEKVAASSECSKVDLVEISQQRSTPGKEIVFLVDCAGGKRFYVSDSELKTQAPAVSLQTKMKSYTDAQFDSQCEVAVKSKLTNPMTYKREFGSSSVYRAPTTANVVVSFNFEASGVLPSKARCVFTDKGLVEATISK